MDRPASLLVVCTGNAARSVMAEVVLAHLARQRGLSLGLASAGTHAVDGLPLGARTLGALRSLEATAGIELGLDGIGRHRSRQLDAQSLEDVELVVAMESAHVRYVQRHHPDAAPRTGTLRRLARELRPGASPLGDRIAALDLAQVVPGPEDDVMDPAGHDDTVYARCAAELWELCNELVRRL